MNILITGGAGYIGSHVVKQLLETTDHDIIVIDNLSTGKSSTLDVLNKIRDFEFINIDLNEFDEVNKIIASKDIYIILHFAASIFIKCFSICACLLVVIVVLVCFLIYFNYDN